MADVGGDIVDTERVDLIELCKVSVGITPQNRMNQLRTVNEVDVAVFNAFPERDLIPQSRMGLNPAEPDRCDACENVLCRGKQFCLTGMVECQYRRFDFFNGFHFIKLIFKQMNLDAGTFRLNIFGCHAKARVVDRARKRNVRIEHHIGGQMLPFVDLGAKFPFDAAEIRVFHGADKRAVDIQLMPRHLVNGYHRLLHMKMIQRAPKLPFLVVFV